MPQNHNENGYSLWVGMIFIFNIIVGTGALTLPAAFAKAGWALGTISIIFLAFMSYINATFIIESMSCANAILKWRKIRLGEETAVKINEGTSEETSPLIGSTEEIFNDVPISAISRYYAIDKCVELGEMANLLFTRFGRVIFYIAMVLYLYGDLSIYSAAIAKSTMDIICSYPSSNSTNLTLSYDIPCFNSTVGDIELSRLSCYRIVLISFLILVGPFVFSNVQKTKYLQIFTSVTRWLAFGIMISLAIRLLVNDGKKGNPPAFDMSGIPALFGACIYSFMCHHSLPGMITPITPKKKLSSSLSIDFILIGIFYTVLALTGIFAFENLEDLYTLNFISSIEKDGPFLRVIDYFLALFPVFTLSTTFPVIAITLRNNIQSIFLDMSNLHTYNLFLRRILFPIIALIPPILLTMFFEDITVLVSFTGSYAGTAIQYLIPTFLVIAARKECNRIFPPSIKNEYGSPFKHSLWGIFIFTWSIICVIMVSLNLLKHT